MEGPQTHKKIQQIMDLLLANPRFREDAKNAKKRLNRIIEKAGYIQAILDKEIAKVMDSNGRTSAKGILKAFKRLRPSGYFNKRITPLEEKKINEEVEALTKKYNLHPKESWYGSIKKFILFDNLEPPSNFFSRKEITLVADTEELFRQQNFGIKMDLNEPALFIRVYSNTSLGDVKKGWKLIENLRNRTYMLYGKKRFYPLKNLSLAKQILGIDNKDGVRKGVTDWVKRNEIFGDTDDFKEEDKGIGKIKITRHRYKRRFGLKS